jgi:hypothetical protein
LVVFEIKAPFFQKDPFVFHKANPDLFCLTKVCQSKKVFVVFYRVIFTIFTAKKKGLSKKLVSPLFLYLTFLPLGHYEAEGECSIQAIDRSSSGTISSEFR